MSFSFTKCQTLSSGKFLSVLTVTVLSLSLSNISTAKPGGAGTTCSITTTPDNAIINVGQSVDFTGGVTGKRPKSYSWSFTGGNPSTASTQSVTVNYSSAGNFPVTLEGTNGKGGACTTITTVTVNDNGGGTNQPPVALDDSYLDSKNQIQSIPAPGVLSNDTDPDGDDLTAHLETDVSSGTLSLNADGSFVYTPDNNFIGQDSFTYVAKDTSGAPSASATVTIDVTDDVSINTTSRNVATPLQPAQEQPIVTDPSYQVVAINDLGMHCGDLDTRISSILPPFNVLHAQVVERGLNGNMPRVMNEGEVTLTYSAASNPNDPALAYSPILSKDGSLYKTNFWDIALQAYAPFYPPGILDLFYSSNPDDNVDIGLPVPDVERLYLEDGTLHAGQQAMPGIANPNDPQVFEEHIGTLPFFINFPFGYTADVNWFEAAGIPISVYDDSGRENPYPLMRVQAEVNGNIVASVDTVVPISGEAECQRCHASADDGGNGSATQRLINDGISLAISIDDPAANVPNDASVEWASDINILRLHDLKHGTILDQGYDSETGRATNPVVCQTCHYTPALDLAQVGPKGEENDPANANGRDQVKHRSMSNVMHRHHGSVTDTNGNKLFPEMPPAVDAQGNKRSPQVTKQILEQTCYSCHPGRKTECMRGAMANGGLVCQDCHGNMEQVGNDFSNGVSPSTPGAFILAADFYHNPATPRVPWANEPGCGSCHTGGATENLSADANVLVNPVDSAGNVDGIRLAQAFRTNDTKATPIVPVNKQFAEDVVAEGAAADGNPKLYRVSTGHADLFCESCHGATHAEWPNANPYANDNKTAEQIQGHSGTITECIVCHDSEFNIEDFKRDMTNKGVMQGPHGMHPVDSAMWNEKHKEVSNLNKEACQACHGPDLKGTVLSRTAADRDVRCKSKKGSLPGCAADQERTIIPKGTPVGCGMCHAQKR